MVISTWWACAAFSIHAIGSRRPFIIGVVLCNTEVISEGMFTVTNGVCHEIQVACVSTII